MAIIKLDGGYNALPISYKRGNPIPLDTTAVWYDFEALETYAASGVTAYVGQVLTYVNTEKNTATAYVIANTNGDLEPIGTSPVGDDKSIVVAENGTVSLKGIVGLVFERDILGEDGRPTGEKEEVKYQPLMTKDGLTWVEPSKTTVEGLAVLIDNLTSRVKALEDNRVTEEELVNAIKDFATDDEVAAAVKVVADKLGIPETETKTAYELIAAEVTRATGVEGELRGLIGVAKTDDTDASGVYAYVDGVVNALVNGVDPKAIDSLNELIAWVEAHPAIVEELDGRLDAVEAIVDGFGGTDEPATVKGYVDETFATKGELNGVKATAEAAQTAGQVATAISTTLADYDTSAQVDTKLADYIKSADVEEDYAKKATTLAGYGIADAYTATQTDEKIAAKIKEMTGGESAADVLVALNNYKASNDREVWGDAFVTEHTVEGVYTPDYTGESRVDKHADRILALENKVGHDVDGETPADGLFKEIDEVRAEAVKGIGEAKSAAATADGKAETNKAAIATLEGAHNSLAHIVNGVDNTNSHAAQLAALAAKDTQLAEQISALQGADATVEATLAEHTGKFTTLETVTIPGLQGEINGKVAQGDHDTLAAKVDTGDKKVSAYVADAIKDLANDTAIKALITAEENRAKGEEARIEGLVTAEAQRADAAEKANAQAITDLTNGAVKANADAIALLNEKDTVVGSVKHTVATELAKIISDDDADIDTLNEIAAWIINDKTGAAKMANDIAALNNKVDTGDKNVSAYVADAIKDIPGAIAQSLADAKQYTDEKMVKADGTSIENKDGTFSVKAVSTDVLVQGKDTLILNGGNASLSE